MKKLLSRSGIASLVYAAGIGVAHASGGDSGTGAVAEMNVSGAQFGMMVGGLVVMGLVIWGVIKVVNR
jgi:hypothetical protein